MVTAAAPLADIDWPDSYRIIRTIYPPVDLFEDIADPADWELIASAEAKTNPRVRDQIGDLSLVPVDWRRSHTRRRTALAGSRTAATVSGTVATASMCRSWRRPTISSGSCAARTNQRATLNIAN
jgi:hypothetical protein